MGIFSVKATAPASSELVPAGNHSAVLVAMIDLGTQKDPGFDGKERNIRQLFLVWELTDEKVPGINRNHVIGNKYNLSFGQNSNLRKLAETWRNKEFAVGEDFDLSKMVGKSCLLTISHKTSQNEKVYAKIDAVAPVPKGMVVAKPGCQPFFWEMGDSDAILEKEWLPRIFGRPILDVVNASAERRGGAAKDAADLAAIVAPVAEEFDRF